MSDMALLEMLRRRFSVDEYTAVLDDDLHPVEPGSGIVGRLARRGHLPIGYYKDAEKTAATFVEADGVRWALPGDHATVDVDGTIVLRGRGSLSINTGGEKVFSEEVEEVLLAYPAIRDAVVVGAGAAVLLALPWLVVLGILWFLRHIS